MNTIFDSILWLVAGANLLFATVDSLMYVMRLWDHGIHSVFSVDFDEKCTRIKIGAIHHLAWAIIAILLLNM